MFGAIVLLVLLNILLVLVLHQRSKDSNNLEKTLTDAEKEANAGKEIAIDLGKRCRQLEHERNYYHDAYKASELKRKELVERLNSIPGSIKAGAIDASFSEI